MLGTPAGGGRVQEPGLGQVPGQSTTSDELAKGNLEYSKYRKMLASLADHIILSAKDGSALRMMPGPDQLPAAVEVKRSRKPSTGTPRKTTGLKRAPSRAKK